MDKLFELPEIVTLAGHSVGPDFDDLMLLAAGGNTCSGGTGDSNTCGPGSGGKQIEALAG